MNPLIYVGCLALTGIAAGFSSGLFGVGGGFLMVPVQYWLLANSGFDGTIATRVAFGTSLAVALPTMISGTAGHHRKGAVSWAAAIPMGIAAVFGALIGGTLAAYLPGSILRIVFSVVVVTMAIRMLWKIQECSACDIRGSLPVYLVTGCMIGILSGLAGIGGGVLLVPILVIFLRFPMHLAVGTSSACLIFSLAGAVSAYIFHGWGMPGLPPYSFGYINLAQWAVLAATTIPMAWIGAKGAHRCPARTLQIIFAGVMILIGLLMLIST